MSKANVNIAVVASQLIMKVSSNIWSSCTIKDLGFWATGSGFPLDYQGHSGMPYPLYKVSDMNRAGNEIYMTSTANTIDETIAKTIGAKIHPVGTVIFPKIGGAIATNKRRILAQKSAIDNNLLGITPKDSTDSEWLYHLLRGIDFTVYQSGTSVPAIKQSVIGELPVPLLPKEVQTTIAQFLTWLDKKEGGTSWDNAPSLPPQLEEQRSLVARIEQLAAKIAEARGLRSQAVKEVEALPNSELTAIFKALLERNDACQLDKLLLEAGYGTSTKCEYERLENSVPVLRIPNVASERVNFDDVKYGTLTNAELDRVLVIEGDVLVVRTNGSADLVGRCAVVPTLSEPTAFASYLIRLRCDRQTVDSDYLQLILKHLRTAGKLFDFARTTAGQYNVSLGRLRAAQIPIPPLSEQRRIVTYLDNLQAKVDALKQMQAETAAELNALLPSILDKAFKGEL